MTLPGVERLGCVRLVVTDRRGGASRSPWDSLNLADHVGDDPGDVAGNRELVARHLGAAAISVVTAEHGNRVHLVDSAGPAAPGDGLVTTQPGLALLALSADCVAGTIAATDIGGAGVFHSGWRGVASGTAPAVVAALVGLGADPELAQVRLGPAICPSCYPVSPTVRDEVSDVVPAAAAVAADGSPALDITAGVCWQLAQSGVHQVVRDGRCTAEHPELFSHRRDGITGRQGIMALLEPV